jgi:long-chain acyl-CoA synthetase
MSKDANQAKPWLEHYDAHVPHTLTYPPVTLNDLLEAAIEKYPEQIFLRFREAAFTYREVGNWIDRFSQNLLRMGVQKGERVAILLPNLPQFVIAYYAVLKVGGIVAAMNPFYKPQEYRFLFHNSTPTIAIGLDAHLEVLRELREEIPLRTIITTGANDWKDYRTHRFEGNLKEGQAEYRLDELVFSELKQKEIPFPQVSPDDPAIYQYSGGTTGTPKAAIGLQRNIAANVWQFKRWCDLKEQREVILAAIPLYHVYGMVLAMNLGAALGAQIVLVDDAREVEFILEQIERHQVTFYPGVPGMYYAINQNAGVRAGKHNLRSIKACISGSAPLHPQIKEEFERLTGGKLVEGYGLSEAPTATHCNPLFGENKPGSIGLPLPDVECRVVDLETGTREVKTGEVGELTLRGPQVMRSYYNEPEETGKAIQDGWL